MARYHSQTMTVLSDIHLEQAQVEISGASVTDADEMRLHSHMYGIILMRDVSRIERCVVLGGTDELAPAAWQN